MSARRLSVRIRSGAPNEWKDMTQAKERLDEVTQLLLEIMDKILAADDDDEFAALEAKQSALLEEYSQLVSDYTDELAVKVEDISKTGNTLVDDIRAIGKDLAEKREYIIQLEEMRFWDKQYVEVLNERVVQLQDEITQALKIIIDSGIDGTEDWVEQVQNSSASFLEAMGELTGAGKVLH